MPSLRLTAQNRDLVFARLAAARLACFPTDTVYGLGGRVAPVVRETLAGVKGRDPGKPFQVIFANLEQLVAQLDLLEPLRRACGALLPGPFTLLVPAPPAWREWARAGVLGVRVPSWPTPAALLSELPFALLASSANRSGRPAAAAPAEIEAGILAACDVVIDAGPLSGTASGVVDLSHYGDDRSWRLLRAGPVAESEIAARLAAGGAEAPTSG